MAGKGRIPGTIIKGKPERDQLIIDYWRQGHGIRETALVFRMSRAGVGKIVLGLSRAPPASREDDDLNAMDGSLMR